MSSEQFSDLANDVIGWLCRNSPERATFLGNHAFDGELSDPSPSAANQRRVDLERYRSHLQSASMLDRTDEVDAEILAIAVEGDLYHLIEIQEATWNPMLHNPGQALYGLLSRDFAPIEQRLESLRLRIGAVPDYFDAARERLADLSAIHTETAIAQLDGLVGLLVDAIPATIAQSGRGVDLTEAAGRAAAATREHQAWLRERLPDARHDPRLGSERFGRKLSLVLATEWDAAELLEQARKDLERVEAELADQVARTTGRANPDTDDIAREFARLAEDQPTSETILRDCAEALDESRRFVADHDLITLQGDPVEIIEMPEIDRGVAVAYCRGVGPLETAPLLTQFAVSPTPSDWSAERTASFYREYNRHMLHNLTVHEAMPGHVEQLSHSRRYEGRSKVRSVFTSGSFVEGWAVYAEELMASEGYRADVSQQAAGAVRMQQLKLQLRMILNTILDISFHTGDLDATRAMELMTGRGYQEDGEAAGKWRRVQLTSTQLCTYYVGYLEVRELSRDLARVRPELSVRQRHDAMLSYGSPPARHIRRLLDL